MTIQRDMAKSIFANALEIAEASARQSYLDAACGGDESLRREIQDLLAHREQMGAFLESPAPAPEATVLGGDDEPTAVGRNTGAISKPPTKTLVIRQPSQNEPPARGLASHVHLTRLPGQTLVPEDKNVAVGRKPQPTGGSLGIVPVDQSAR